MTQDAPPTTNATPEAPPADAAPRSAAATWLPILTSALCIGLMAVVLVLATKDEEPQGERPAVETSSTSTPPVGAPGDHELFGVQPRGPQAPPPGALAGCGDLDPEKPPVLELDVEGGEIDFGNLKQGVQVVKEVTFRSAGTGPLCVVSAKSSCGCLKASLTDTKRVYAPGETGIVRLAVDTTGRMGAINKRVTITSNDPRSPLTSFRVKMDINAGLMSDPRYLQFGNVPPETSTSRALYLRTKKDDADWKVTGVKSIRKVQGMKPVAYTFEVEELHDPNFRRVKVRIIHPGMSMTGSFHDKLVVTTTHPERPEVHVNAHIHVVPRIVFRARQVSLGFVRPGVPRAPTRARVEAGAPGITFAVTGVEVLPAEGTGFDAAGAPFTATFGKDGRSWWVDVKYDGKTRKPGLVKAVILVRTDDKAQPELRIPVRATVQAPKAK